MTTALHSSSITISEALEQLRTPDGVICFKLNGRYVLSCNPYHQEAVQRINQLKGRQLGRPLVMVFEDLKSIERAEIHSPLLHLLPRFAPLVTLSIPAPVGISRAAHQGTGMLGVGLVDQGAGRALLSEWGGPLLVSSANPTGAPSPRTLSDLAGYGFNLPLLSGPEGEAQRDESLAKVTVVTLASSQVKVLSEGQVTERELRDEWSRLVNLGLI